MSIFSIIETEDITPISEVTVIVFQIYGEKREAGLNMEIPGFYMLLIPLTLVLLPFNCLISKDINDWIPSLKEQIGLHILVWLLPVAGFFLANKFGDLGWFKENKSKNRGSVISGGLLGVDEVFNPGTKHVIEIIEEHKSEIRHEYKHADDKNKNTEQNT